MAQRQIHLIKGRRRASSAQRLILHERILAEEIRELERQRAKIRGQIRQRLARGAKCAPALRAEEIEALRILGIR